MPDLRIENLSFTYAGSPDPVLRSIQLTIPEGQFVLVTGPSGGGKSTLALALTGLIPSRIAGHMRGGVYLGTNDISGMEIHEVSQNIGIVFQNPDNQLVQLTVEEEVAFGPENLGLPRSEVARRVEQALIYTGMDKMRKEQIYALSGGQKQRVAISATLAMLPQVLVLDEPTSDLDPVGTQEVLSVLRTLNKQYGMTIVLVEHKVDEVISWVDRVLLMDQGKVIVDFFMHNLIGRTMLGYFLIFSVPTIVPFLFVKLIGFKGLRHLFSYEPKQSIIHGLDPRLKVTYPVLIGILSIFLNWDFVYYLVGFTLIPWMFLRPSPARSRVIITMAGVPVIGAIWSQGLFHTEGNSIQHLIVIFPWTLSWLGTPGLSSTGLLYGVQQSGRTLAGVLAALILLFTTTPSEVEWAFYKFRLPPAAGLAFSAALRFLPQMLERMTVLLQVVQVRGYDLTIPRRRDLRDWPGYIKRVFACIPVVTVPLLIGALRNTSVMAMVVDARAFGSHNERSTLKEHQITLADGIALGALAAITLAVILLVVLHIGSRLI